MTWYNDFGLFELLLVVAFGVLYAAFLRRNAVMARRLRSRGRSAWVKFTLRAVYFALLVVALLGPMFGAARREVQAVGKDIYLAVDLSRSMDAVDVQPTRLAKVKFELKNMADALSGDRIGLIIFSSDAFVQCPLTYDQNALTLFIETLNTDLVPSTGTDFGPPLEMAIDKHLDPENTTVRNQAKVIVLISDGEDFGEDYDDEVRRIEEAGIRLFTLGVGTQAGSTIPTAAGPKTDREGRPITTRLQPDALRELARRTDGDYYEITDRVNETRQLVRAVQTIEGELRDTRFVDASANKYFYFLVAALALIVVDALFTVRVIRI